MPSTANTPKEQAFRIERHRHGHQLEETRRAGNRKAGTSASRRLPTEETLTQPGVLPSAQTPLGQIQKVRRRFKKLLAHRPGLIMRAVRGLDEPSAGVAQAGATGTSRRLRGRGTNATIDARRTGNRTTSLAGHRTRRTDASSRNTGAHAGRSGTGYPRTDRSGRGLRLDGKRRRGRAGRGRPTSQRRCCRFRSNGRRRLSIHIRNRKLTLLPRDRGLSTGGGRPDRKRRPRIATTGNRCNRRFGNRLARPGSRLGRPTDQERQRAGRIGLENIDVAGRAVHAAPGRGNLLLVENERKPPVPLNGPDLLDISERARIATTDLNIMSPKARHERDSSISADDQLEQKRVDRIHDKLRHRLLNGPGEEQTSPDITSILALADGDHEFVTSRNRQLPEQNFCGIRAKPGRQPRGARRHERTGKTGAPATRIPSGSVRASGQNRRAGEGPENASGEKHRARSGGP